jgi:RNA polymerase sigma factor (sigma-70 family)
LVAVPSIGRAGQPTPRHAAPEADATRRLYEQYARQIHAYCLHQLRNKEEAEDATQSTFLNAFRGLQRGIAPEFEAAWLYKIAQNVCLTRQRSSSRRRRVESPGDLDAMQDALPAREVDSDQLIGLPEALEDMPEQQRRALLLREWQGLSYKEIADELDLSQAAVETLLFRARRTLAAGLADEPKRGLGKRLQKGGDVGSLLALVKSLLFTGGAKVAATVVTVAATSIVAASPAARHAVEQVAATKTPAPSVVHEAHASTAAVAAPVSVAGPVRQAAAVAPVHLVSMTHSSATVHRVRAESKRAAGIVVVSTRTGTPPKAAAPATPAPDPVTPSAPPVTPAAAAPAPPAAAPAPVPVSAPPAQAAPPAPAATPVVLPPVESGHRKTHGKGGDNGTGSDKKHGVPQVAPPQAAPSDADPISATPVARQPQGVAPTPTPTPTPAPAAPAPQPAATPPATQPAPPQPDPAAEQQPAPASSPPAPDQSHGTGNAPAGGNGNANGAGSGNGRDHADKGARGKKG